LRFIEEERDTDHGSEGGSAENDNKNSPNRPTLFPIVISIPQPCAIYLNAQGHVIRSGMPPGLQVKLADSFLAFMEGYADRLEQGVYSIKKNMVWRFANTGDPCGSDTTTHGIRIRANALFIPEQSNEDERAYLFAYCIRISWAGPDDHNMRYQLTMRHWQQRHANGQVERIDGEGVIGQYPVMYKGCPEFQYCSCTRQASPHDGQMSGSFDFRVGDTEEEISCAIAPFLLDVNRTFT